MRIDRPYGAGPAAFWLLLLTALLPLRETVAQGTFAYGDSWRTNPLGFSPLNLHTRNGLLVPAFAVGVALLVTPRDTSLSDRWRFYGDTGLSEGYKPPHTSVYLGNVGVLYRVRRWMEVGVEASYYGVRDRFNHTWGLGLRPVARFYPVDTERWRLYVESGAGLVYFAERFPTASESDPRTGTNLNGSPKYGAGAEIRLTSSAHLMVGLRHVHVSNGNARGADRNPSHDSNGFFAGVAFTPLRNR